MSLGYALEAAWGTLFGPDNTQYDKSNMQQMRTTQLRECVHRFERLRSDHVRHPKRHPAPFQC